MITVIDANDCNFNAYMKRLGLILVFFSLAFSSAAQLLTSVPEFIQESSTTIEITADATYGNKGIKDYATTSDVYVHIGCITSLSTNSTAFGSDGNSLTYCFANGFSSCCI